MKKIIVAFLLLVCNQWMEAQNVGIGTNAPDPTAQLDISSSTKGMLAPRMTFAQRNAIVSPAIGLLVFQTDMVAGLYYYNNVASGWKLISTATFTNYWSAFGVHIYNANSGNVGIGLPIPAYKLSVGGDIYIQGNPPTLRISGETDAGAAQIRFALPSNTTDYNITQAANKLFISRNIGALGFASDLVVDPSGFVGIGTSLPEAKLHVTSNVLIGSGTPAAGYLLSVNGKMIAEEVRVELDATWPDYVFEKDYRLLPLTQLEKFIQCKKHLPNIPAASQVANEGISLGNMNGRLLEKIEELTLYIIQQDKKLTRLQQQVKSLQSINR